MDDILISVIVPAYNIEDYIARCLDSLLAQTHQNLEIIVVDDGSSDQTGAVIDSYAERDPRIVSIHKENGGVSSARITGVKLASGNYIGFADGDDFVEPEMYRVLLENAVAYDADISHCGYKMVFPDGHEDLYYGTEKRVVHDNKQGLSELLKGDYIEPGLVNKLYRSSIVKGFEQSPLWDSTIRINEDLLMNYILFKRSSRSVYEDVILYRYMLRKNSAATSSVQRYKITDPINVTSLIWNDTKEDSELESIAYERYLRTLIKTVEQTSYIDESLKAKQLLKEEIKQRNTLKKLRSTRVEKMAFCAAHLPGVYRLVRKVYGKLSGVSDKYKL